MSLRKTILLVSALGEYFLNHYDDGMRVLYHPGRYLYNSFEDTADRRAVQKSLSSLVSKGLLEKKRRDGYYQLTAVGWAQVGALRPLGKVQRQKWDGLWRIVIYDVPEEKRVERDFLRWRLKELGFRLWQKSTWITPLEVSKELYNLLKGSKLTGRISVFESRNLFGLGNRDLAAKVWGLENVKFNYQKLIREWKEGKKAAGDNPLKIKELARRLQLQYLALAQKDPRLPVELLPEKWPEEGLKKTLSEIRTTLSS